MAEWSPFVLHIWEVWVSISSQRLAPWFSLVPPENAGIVA